MRCNSGLSNSFSECFFFIGSIAPARKTQNRCLFHPTSKKFVPPQHKLLVFTTPTLELRSNAFPSAGGTCPVPSASVGQKRKTFNLSEREELVRHLLAGSEDGVLKHGAYANPGMIMNRPLPRVGTPFFFIECDVLIHALRSTPETHTCRAVSLSRRWVRSSKISAISPTR